MYGMVSKRLQEEELVNNAIPNPRDKLISINSSVSEQAATNGRREDVGPHKHSACYVATVRSWTIC